jgi:hypothetical protein
VASLLRNCVASLLRDRPYHLDKGGDDAEAICDDLVAGAARRRLWDVAAGQAVADGPRDRGPGTSHRSSGSTRAATTGAGVHTAADAALLGASIMRRLIVISTLALLIAACGTSQPSKPAPTVLGTQLPAPAATETPTEAPADATTAPAPAPQAPAPPAPTRALTPMPPPVYTPPPTPHY